MSPTSVASASREAQRFTVWILSYQDLVAPLTTGLSTSGREGPLRVVSHPGVGHLPPSPGHQEHCRLSAGAFSVVRPGALGRHWPRTGNGVCRGGGGVGALVLP